MPLAVYKISPCAANSKLYDRLLSEVYVHGVMNGEALAGQEMDSETACLMQQLLAAMAPFSKKERKKYQEEGLWLVGFAVQ